MPDCGKGTRSDFGRDAHALRHQREKDAKTRTKGRNTSRAKPVGSAFGKPAKATRGKHVDLSTGKRFRNHLELNSHARRLAETEDRAKERIARGEARTQERARRTKATTDRKARGGRPQGTPKKRNTTKLRTPEARARFHAHMAQHAAGRMDRDGNRLPHEPSPAKVRPRTRTAPKVR